VEEEKAEEFSFLFICNCTFGLLQKLKLKLIFYCIIATKRNLKNNKMVSNPPHTPPFDVGLTNQTSPN